MKEECERKLCEKDVEMATKQAAQFEVEIEWNAAKDALKNHQLLVVTRMLGLEARDARKWKAAEDVLKDYESDVTGRKEAEQKCIEHAKQAENTATELHSVCEELDSVRREKAVLQEELKQMKQELETCKAQRVDEVEAAWKDVFSKPLVL